MQEDLNIKKWETLKKLNQESHEATRECIRTALLSLLAVETFEQITVTKIINRAGVSRGGFYRNYASKEEVLREIGNGLFQYLMNLVLETKNYTDMKQWYQEFFQKIEDNTEEYRLLIKAKVPTDFVFQFDQESLLKTFQKDSTNMERYRAIAIVKALAEISLDWFQNGMKESPAEMAEIVCHIFH